MHGSTHRGPRSATNASLIVGLLDEGKIQPHRELFQGTANGMSVACHYRRSKPKSGAMRMAGQHQIERHARIG
jgi:hypothetical protein